ncbi:MAG: hypothetical protein ABI830_07690, partial [Pseudolabrys sp.]
GGRLLTGSRRFSLRFGNGLGCWFRGGLDMRAGARQRNFFGRGRSALGAYSACHHQHHSQA